MLLKIITVCMICVLLINAVTVCANNLALTKEEAEELLIEGYNRMWLFYCGRTISGDSFKHKYLREDKIELGDGDGYYSVILFETTTTGVPLPQDINGAYRVVTDERFNTLDKCYDYINKIFTDDISQSAVTENRFIGTPLFEKYETFRLSDGGKILKRGETEWKPLEPGKVVYASMPTMGQAPMCRLKSIGEFTANANTANLEVEGLSAYGGTNIPLTCNMNVTFQNTPKGWRISGGSFIEALMFTPEGLEYFKNEYFKNPSTSSPTPIYLALAGAALVGVCLPVVKRKRRRI